MIKSYEGLPKFVLETTYGCYSDYEWGVAATLSDKKEAIEKCDFWLSKGGEYRVVSDGKLIYPLAT